MPQYYWTASKKYIAACRGYAGNAKSSGEELPKISRIDFTEWSKSYELDRRYKNAHKCKKATDNAITKTQIIYF